MLASIVVFLAFSMTWRSSNIKDKPLGDGMMRNMSGMFYEKLGKKKIDQEIRSATQEVNDNHTRDVGSRNEGEGDG